MNKKASLLIGLTLILLGILALVGNLLIQAAGVGSMLSLRAWPILVVGVGLLFCIPPFLFPRQRGLSGLFIPGLPILTTGVLLFITSVGDRWSIWASFWPLEVLSLAVAFILMAIFLKVPWLMIPASIISFTGAVLQFCAATGWWSSWAALWTVEPFAVGLPLLLIGLFKRIEGVKLAGIILCGLAGLAFAAMSPFLVTSQWISRLVGPGVVLVLGVLLLVAALVRRSPEKVAPAAKPEPPEEEHPEEPAETPSEEEIA
jgi:hypothetical protein